MVHYRPTAGDRKQRRHFYRTKLDAEAMADALKKQVHHVGAPALALTPLQIGIWGPRVQLFPESTEVVGLRLNLLKSDNAEVMGFDLGVVGQATAMKAIQVNLVNLVDEEFDGIGVGLFNQVGTVAPSLWSRDSA